MGRLDGPSPVRTPPTRRVSADSRAAGSVSRSTTIRSIAGWVATALIVALSLLGLKSAVDQLQSAGTLGQQTTTATQFGYAVAGLVAAGGLLARRSWAGKPLWLWAGLLTVTGGMAPVVWGGAGVAVGFVAGVASAAVAALVIWLVSLRRVA